ncbi:MAG: Regulatory protein ArsR [Microgenomates group bacterium GW2011_GWB1_44_8]|nr:MAG: Regulatory protein ArsR [Microgenomates group bacterium GW2011_GWB1_44_8]
MDDTFREVFRLHANFYKLLANDRRLEIIQLLGNGALTVGEMSKMLSIPQPNLSQHLAVLRISGILQADKRGRKVYYKLMSKKITKSLELLREVFLGKVLNSRDIANREIAKNNPADAFEVVTDPVCGMKINKKTAIDRTTYKGKTYYFCASGCRRRFNENSGQFASL